MKPRYTKYNTLVCQKIIRKIADRDKFQLNDEWRRFFADGTPPPLKVTRSPFTCVKVLRRGDNGVVPPDGCDYLVVVSHEMDGNGDWLPSEVRAVQSVRELKEALRQMVANSDSVVVKASSWFEHVAAGLGLRHLTTEWGCL